MTITLNPEQSAYVRQQARRHGLSDPAEYVERMISRDCKAAPKPPDAEGVDRWLEKIAGSLDAPQRPSGWDEEAAGTPDPAGPATQTEGHGAGGLTLDALKKTHGWAQVQRMKTMKGNGLTADELMAMTRSEV